MHYSASNDARRNPGFSVQVREAVADIVRKQVAAGITVVNDGEMSKVGYATYVTERLTGFDGPSRAGITLVEALAEGAQLASEQLWT